MIIKNQTGIVEHKECSVIGINGLDCSGKTFLSKKLLEKTNQYGVNSKLIHIDDYGNKEIQRTLYEKFAAGSFSADDLDMYYEKGINYNQIARCINNLKQECNILIVEGVFMFKPILRDFFNFKIFLEIDQSIAIPRYSNRKKIEMDTRPLDVFEQIWIPSYKRYCRDIDPYSLSDIVIYNDFQKPIINRYNKNIKWLHQNKHLLKKLKPI